MFHWCLQLFSPWYKTRYISVSGTELIDLQPPFHSLHIQEDSGANGIYCRIGVESDIAFP